MNKEIKFILNNREIQTNADPKMSALKFLREKEDLKSVKLGCGEGECGACTVLLGELRNGEVRYKNVASCILPLGDLESKHLVTLEGINQKELTPVQKVMVDEGAIQCGFCTPGFVMSMTGFFMSDEAKTNENVLSAIDGNICRCTGYFPIKRAAEKLVKFYGESGMEENPVGKLIELSFLPSYFSTISKRLSMLSKREVSPDISDRNVLVGGGTDLFVGDKIADETNEPLFLSRIDGLDRIFSEENEIYLGAGATTEDIKNSKIIRNNIENIDGFFSLISSAIIRNRATLGGNIVNASPIGDLSVFFLALNSTLILTKNGLTREVNLKDFFKDYKIFDLGPGEIIKYVKFKKPGRNETINFEKVSRRRHLDIASCNSAIRIKFINDKVESCSISAGGVAPVPFFLREASSFITGEKPDEKNLIDMVEIAKREISPISDIRGSSDYKRNLLGRLIISHFVKIFPHYINIGELI